MAPIESDSLLPASAANVKDIDSYIDTVNKLSNCISNAINEGKSVTAVNKKLVVLAAEEIRRCTSTLAILKSVETPALDETFKSEIITSVRKEIEQLKTELAPSVLPVKATYANVVASKTYKPSIILQSTDPNTKPQEVLNKWRKSVSFKKETYAPAKVQTGFNGKVRIEFDTKSQCQETIARINKIEGLQAEESKRRPPLVILKGISKHIEKNELIDIIEHQNSLPKGNIRLCFATSNRNENLYNAVFEVKPELYKSVILIGRIAIDHQRVHIEPYSRFVQCYKCLLFGHTKNKCTSETNRCAHCASEEHNITSCPFKETENKRKCFNCHNFNIKSNSKVDTNHIATNAKLCLRIKTLKNKIDEQTDYGQ
ncbi:unnamed protein product [Parnassius apollo]|uniref:(apollo) hypothetical protein n=1 Tax=Parnassius apollo TaxID=110799 RepID=A0A8S3WZQ2_PARAO|nr:unnamed protein product [Parnassius apollo]